MTRVKKRRADGHNRGIRDAHGDLWEVELGRHAATSVDDEPGDAPEGQVIFCRKPDGFAFGVRIPPGLTLADYDDEALVAMIEQRLREEGSRRVG